MLNCCPTSPLQQLPPESQRKIGWLSKTPFNFFSNCTKKTQRISIIISIVLLVLSIIISIFSGSLSLSIILGVSLLFSFLIAYQLYFFFSSQNVIKSINTELRFRKKSNKELQDSENKLKEELIRLRECRKELSNKSNLKLIRFQKLNDVLNSTSKVFREEILTKKNITKDLEEIAETLSKMSSQEELDSNDLTDNIRVLLSQILELTTLVNSSKFSLESFRKYLFEEHASIILKTKELEEQTSLLSDEIKKFKLLKEENRLLIDEQRSIFDQQKKETLELETSLKELKIELLKLSELPTTETKLKLEQLKATLEELIKNTTKPN